jgi:hypothetical protein
MSKPNLRVLIGGSLLLTLVLLGGCNNNEKTDETSATDEETNERATGDPTTTDHPKPCTLFTKDMAEELLGVEVDTETDDDLSCMYMDASGNYYTSVMTRYDTPTTTEAVYQSSLEQAQEREEPEFAMVDDLGDGAFYSGTTFNQLSVLSDDCWLLITVAQGNEEDNLPKAKELAELMLDLI